MIREAHKENKEYDADDLEHSLLGLFGSIEEAIDQFIDGIPKNYIKSGENEEIKRLRE